MAREYTALSHSVLREHVFTAGRKVHSSYAESSKFFAIITFAEGRGQPAIPWSPAVIAVYFFVFFVEP